MEVAVVAAVVAAAVAAMKEEEEEEEEKQMMGQFIHPLIAIWYNKHVITATGTIYVSCTTWPSISDFSVMML